MSEQENIRGAAREFKYSVMWALALLLPISGFAFLLMSIFRESFGKLAVALVFPLLIVKSIGEQLPDQMFWVLFWLLQFLYVFAWVVLFRVIRKRKRSPS